jgi:hypothetical protein
MPAGDGTGPMGMGPMSGRAAGYCGGYDLPGWANPVPGRGFGLGWTRGGARGRGWRHRHWTYATGASAWGAPSAWGYRPFAPPPNREQETEALRQQAEWLKKQLDDIGQRLADLEGEE